MYKKSRIKKEKYLYKTYLYKNTPQLQRTKRGPHAREALEQQTAKEKRIKTVKEAKEKKRKEVKQ